ncbi:hypothetical protein BX070DRAFT_133460 [Coemansia spiralis]|nr:hypothetical protein BX070DRAFT_133460 [Coemansia spiralis]
MRALRKKRGRPHPPSPNCSPGIHIPSSLSCPCLPSPFFLSFSLFFCSLPPFCSLVALPEFAFLLNSNTFLYSYFAFFRFAQALLYQCTLPCLFLADSRLLYQYKHSLFIVLICLSPHAEQHIASRPCVKV